mgnify:FL=1
MCDLPTQGAAALQPLPHGNQERWYAELAISLNAQQYSPLESGRVPPGSSPTFVLPIDVRASFAIYTEPSRTAKAKLEAIHGGGQQVTVYGGDLHGGCAYACRFGEEVRAGSYDERRGSLRCDAPTRDPGTIEEVWISLNGQQFAPSGANLTWV